MTDLTPPFAVDPARLRAGTPFVGQNTVDTTPLIVTNDGWYPDVDLSLLRRIHQIDDSVANERLQHAVTKAVISVNAELTEWQCDKVKSGYDSLADVPTPELGTLKSTEFLYLNAVYATTLAILNYRYWAVADTVGKTLGAQQASTAALSESADEYQRERWESLQLLRGEPRTLTGAL